MPQGGAEGPLLYLLVILPLAFELAQVYPGYAPYPLRSPLIHFADDNLLATATRHRDPENAGLPTTTEQASAIRQLTTAYLDAHQLLVHPLKSVGLADTIGFTRIGQEERRDGEAIALHKTHIWANSLKPVCFLCFLLFWCPLLPFIETGTLKIYTKMVLYMKNEIFALKYPLHGV